MAPVDPLYATTDLDNWINQARNQLAGESQSIRVLGTVDTTAGINLYPFSSITVTGTSGVASALHVRSIRYAVGTGYSRLRVRNYEWFESYELNTAVPPSGPPQVWAQYAQGEAGSFFVSPVPDDVYVMTCDCVCLPIALVDDTTPEAIPPLWQDAVAYFAAYLALLSAQSAQRQSDANRMFERYTEFCDRARRFATPDVNKNLYPQNQDPTLIAKLGLTPKAGAG